MTARVLRLTAIAIAVAAFLDPPLTMTASGRARIAVSADPGNEASLRVQNSLTALLGRDFEVIAGSDRTADAAVVVGSEYPADAAPEQQRVYTVSVPVSPAGMRIVSVLAPREATPGTNVHLSIDIAAENEARGEAAVIVRTGNGIELARSTHAWASTRRWSPAVDVPSVGPPPWHLRVELLSMPAGQTADTADVAIDGADPLRVFALDARPSWAATFVRRALERDRRFDVVGVSRTSRGVEATTGAAAALESLDLESIRAIVVGGLDGLTAPDARALERFIRERGGSVVLLPDSLTDLRAAARWLPVPQAAELLLDNPARIDSESPLSSFAASELLKFQPRFSARTVAHVSGGNEPVIVTAPVGAGRLVVSGALDAWRYRANDGEAFDRFWQAAIAGAAIETRPAVDVAVVPPAGAPGDVMTVLVNVRRSAIAGSGELKVSAVRVGDNEPVRLWPDATSESFHGSFIARTHSGADRIAVTAGNRTGRASFIVSDGARTPRLPGVPLSLLADSHGGVNATADHLGDLLQRVRGEVRAAPTTVERRPMRSPWWLLPFAACLSGEWWLRRRGGLR